MVDEDVWDEIKVCSVKQMLLQLIVETDFRTLVDTTAVFTYLCLMPLPC